MRTHTRTQTFACIRASHLSLSLLLVYMSALMRSPFLFVFIFLFFFLSFCLSSLTPPHPLFPSLSASLSLSVCLIHSLLFFASLSVSFPLSFPLSICRSFLVGLSLSLFQPTLFLDEIHVCTIRYTHQNILGIFVTNKLSS